MSQKISFLRTVFAVSLMVFTLSACETTKNGSSSNATTTNFNAAAAYPKPTVTHVYASPFSVNAQSNPRQRRLYVDLINASTGKEGYAPRYYVVSTDQNDTTLVAVAAQRKYLDNIYQARAGLHRFGASARLLPLLEGHKEAGDYSTLDLLYHLGFKRLILTNGDDFTYRIDLKQEAVATTTTATTTTTAVTK